MRKILIGILTMFALILPVFSSAVNPYTGDEQGRNIGIIMAVMGVALVIMIIIGVTSSKKKK